MNLKGEKAENVIVEKKNFQPEWQGVCCEVVPPTNVSEATDIKISSTWFPKQELKKKNANRHANMEEGKLMKPELQTKNFRQ